MDECIVLDTPEVVTLDAEDMAIIRLGLLAMHEQGTHRFVKAWFSDERSAKANALHRKLNNASAGAIIVTTEGGYPRD